MASPEESPIATPSPLVSTEPSGPMTDVEVSSPTEEMSAVSATGAPARQDRGAGDSSPAAEVGPYVGATKSGAAMRPWRSSVEGAQETVAKNASFDDPEKLCIAQKLMSFSDPHMTIRVLDWLKTTEIYSQSDLNAALQQLLLTTGFDESQHASRGLPPPEAPLVKCEAIHEEFAEIEGSLKSFILCMVQEKQNRATMGDQYDRHYQTDKRTLYDWSEWWVSKYEGREDEPRPKEYQPFPKDVISRLLRLCKLCHDNGDYALELKWLRFIREFIIESILQPDEITPEQHLQVMWALLAAGTLNMQPPATILEADATIPDDAPDDTEEPYSELQQACYDADMQDPHVFAQALIEADDLIAASAQATGRGAATEQNIANITAQSSKDLSRLNQKTWLLHWAFWPVFRYYLPRVMTLSQSRMPIPRNVNWNELTDWLLNDKNLSLVYVTAPHLFRYYTVMMILLRGKRIDHRKNVVNVIAMASHKFRDPFTDLVKALFVDFDFDAAQVLLRCVAGACRADYLLAPLAAVVEEQSRLLVFETNYRIHKSLNIRIIAEKLNMTPEVAERWIVNLIRNSKIEAKIDSERNVVEIATKAPTVYQTVVEKTKTLGVRTSVLIQTLERPAQAEAIQQQAGGRQRRPGGPRSGNNDRRGGSGMYHRSSGVEAN